MRGHLRVLLAVAALSSFFAFATSASAAFVNTGTFASGPGVGNGELTDPGRAAIEQSSGNLFVVDSGNDRVQVFAPNGSGSADYLTQFGNGELSAPWGIAIDENAGQTFVYVADAGNDRIVKYASDEVATPTFTVDPGFTSPTKGSGVGQVGDFHAALAIDPTTHDLLVADNANKRIARFEADGTADGSFDGSAGTGSPGAFAGPIDVAVNSGGDVYVVDANGNIAEAQGTSKALRYSSVGEYKATLAPVGTHERVAAVAVNPATDEVVVSGDQDNVYEAGPPPFVPLIGLFDSADNPLPSPALAASSEYDTVSGLAFATGSVARLYVALDKSYYNGDHAAYGTIQVQAFEDLPLPIVTLAPITGVTGSAAHLSGTVNPQSSNTSYQFQYQIDGEPSWRNIGGSGGGTAGGGAAPVVVEAGLSGLEPNVTYNVRLTASSATGSVTSALETFTTETVAPEIVRIGAAALFTEATLEAQVNPGGVEATYHFEYGPTAAYGSSTPEIAIPAGGTPVSVRANIRSLVPGTGYHFRLVASNSVDDTVGADQSFTTQVRSSSPESCANAAIRAQQQATRLPACRAYELVSPADKSSGTVLAEPFTGAGQSIVSAIAPDGDATTYWSYQAFANSQSANQNSYKAVRSSTGWKSAPVIPLFPGQTNIAFNKVNVVGVTPDLSDFFVRTGLPYDPLDQRPVGFVGSPFDVYAMAPGQPPTWISRPDGNGPDTANFISDYVGSSADGDQVFFQSPEVLNPAAEGLAEAGSVLYERVGGETRMVGVGDDGTALSSCGSALGTYNAQVYGAPSGSANAVSTAQGAISGDGSRVFFSSPNPAEGFSFDPACQVPPSLYVREGGQTVDISRSRRATPDPNPEPAYFQGAALDGSIAYFVSNEALTEDADPSLDRFLYAYEASNDELTLVSPEGDVRGVSAVSDDGSHAYYLQESSPGPGYDLLAFSIADGQSALVAHVNVDNSSSLLWGSNFASTRVTPDGSHFLFEASSITGHDSGGKAEEYLYDAATANLVCVSCSPGGAPSSGNASLSGGLDSLFMIGYPVPRNLSDDGRVFFNTPNPLVAGDVNGTSDVYEWHEGTVFLLSDGRDDRGAYFFGASADGRDVFFSTKASLLRQDYDNGDTDIYDARIEGGFSTPPDAPPCAGEACQGPAPPGPQGQAPASNVFSGPANTNHRKAQHKKTKAKKNKSKKKKAKKQSQDRRHGKANSNTRKGR